MANRAGSPAAPPPADHNNPPVPLTADEMEDLFIVHLAQARQDDDALEKAMETVRGVRKTRTRNRNLCSTDGFPLTELDRILEDEQLDRTEVEKRERARNLMRRAARQPGAQPEQRDMLEELARDEAYWRADGYQAGLRGVELKHPEEMPPEFGQVRAEGYHDGQKRLAAAMETKQRLGKATVQ